MSRQPTRIRYLVFALCCGISGLLYLHRYTWGFIKHDLQKEFHWDSRTMGQLDSWFVASYGFAQIPAGIVCDLFGAHLLLGSSIVVWSLSLVGFAVAGSAVQMAAARFLFGLGQAPCYPVLSKISRNWFPLTMRPVAQGWIATFFGRGGGALSFFVFGTVLVGWLHLSWRVALGVFSVVGLVAGLAFLWLFRNLPGEHPGVNPEEAALIAGGDLSSTIATGSRLRWSSLLRNGSIGFLLARGFIANVADVLYVNWIPTYLRSIHAMENTEAGWVSALPLLGGACGGVMSGWLQSLIIRRTGNRRWARSGVGLMGKGLAAALMVGSLSLGDPRAVACGFLAVKFFSDWEQPAEWGAITDMAGPNAATLFAVVNTLGALGGTLGGPLIGHALQWFSGVMVTAGGTAIVPTPAGWNAVFLMTAGEYLLAASAWLFIDCRQTVETVTPKQEKKL